MAKTIHNLPETKGQFQTRGIVTGTKKDKFYVDKLTKTEKPFRSINFGIQFDKDATLYAGFNGMEQDSVYFFKTTKDEKTGKKSTETKKVAWKDRLTFSQDGFKLIGVNVGVQKTHDSTGKEINDKKSLTQYDACKEIADNLTDEHSVFVKGNIQYSTYNKKHQTKFEPSQISLCKDLDFDAEGFTSMADFQQVIVFTGIEKDTKVADRFIVSAKIVTYNTIEDAEFFIEDAKLANMFRKNLKPYTGIKVWGKIKVSQQTEQVVNEDECWGEENEMTKVSAPTLRELVITGADPKSIEKEVYAQNKIEEAIASINASKQAEKDFGSSDDDDWGSTDTSNSGDDDSEAW
mgnify:CR=1 FL=1